MKITYVDCEQVELEIGDKVCADDGDDRVAGTITQIDEPDIDDSADDGIPQRSGPYIHVEWLGWPTGSSTEKFLGWRFREQNR